MCFSTTRRFNPLLSTHKKKVPYEANKNKQVIHLKVSDPPQVWAQTHNESKDGDGSEGHGESHEDIGHLSCPGAHREIRHGVEGIHAGSGRGSTGEETRRESRRGQKENKPDEGEAGPRTNILHCKRVVRAVDYWRATNIALVGAMTVRR